MKNITTLTLALSLAAGLTGCGSGSSETPKSETPKIVNATDVKIHLSLFDADAGYVTASPVQLQFRGVGVEAGQQPVTSLTLNDKHEADLVVKQLPSKPEILSIVAKAFGYRPASVSLIIPPGGGDRSVVLKMLKEKSGKVTDGIYSAMLDMTGVIENDGKVTQETVLESKESAALPGVTVKIPAGTILTDKDGNPVTDGMMSVVTFDPTKPKAIQAYPGGMNVLADATGFSIGGKSVTGERQINFKSAGFAEIVIKSLDGRSVRHFSNPVEVTMQFREGTKDADGNLIAVGDRVPIWSYETDSGKWRYEKDITGVVSDIDPGDGLYEVRYTTTHLSSWNLDWHYSAVCTANINVIDNASVNQLAQVDHFIVNIPGTSVLNRYVGNNNPSTGDMILYNVPAGYPATVTAYDANGAQLATQNYDDLCGGHTGPGGWTPTVDNEVDLIIDSPNVTTVDVNMTLSCPNNQNIPGTNSSTIPFDAVLTPTTGTPVNLGSDGLGTVAINNSPENFTVTATPAQQSYYAMIDWGNAGNPANNIVSIASGGAFTQNFVLSNAYCAPTSGTISGTELPNPDILYVPRDVAKDAHGNLYVTTWQHGIIKYDGQTVTTLIPAGSGSSSQPYPTSTPVIIDPATPNVFTSAVPTGLDLVMINNKEFLVYADTNAHCVNMIELDIGAVATIAGKCGQPGGDTPGTDVSTQTTPVTATGGGRLEAPRDVAYFPGEKRLFISQNHKVKMVKTGEQNPTIWDVAGTGAIPPVTGYTDGAAAGTTPINPYMLDVTPTGDIIMSDGGHMLSKISDINYAPTGDPAMGAKLYRVTGTYMTPGDFTGQIPAADISTRYNFTRDVEIDAAGNIYFADHYNHRVRRILATTGEVEILAGFGGVTLSTLNQTGPVNVQSIWRPHGLWIESNGDFYLTQIAGIPYGVVRHVTY